MEEKEKLDELLNIRVFEAERKKIEDLINFYKERNNEKYDNISHFIRCAVMKLIREEIENVKTVEAFDKTNG